MFHTRQVHKNNTESDWEIPLTMTGQDLRALRQVPSFGSGILASVAAVWNEVIRTENDIFNYTSTSFIKNFIFVNKTCI